MTAGLRVADLSPFAPREKKVAGYDEAAWLGRLQQHLRASEHVIRLGDTTAEDEDHVISRDWTGQWQAGRYIGEVAFEGRRLEIFPRLGLDVIGKWLEGALNLVAVPETAQQHSSESFIALLMAAIWCRQVDVAARHGPPAFRHDVVHEGFFVRGGLDVRRTARLRGRGAPHVASVTRPRELRNDVSRALVAAERVLTQAVGHDRWRTPRVREILPQLYPAVGARPRLPGLEDLRRIRYRPITRPYKQAAELSGRIARHEGFGAHAEQGHVEGLLLDVAELWELFLLSCVRTAVPTLRVEHGTTGQEKAFLLTSRDRPGEGLGRLKPDILVSDGEGLVAVIDAKYKRLVDRRPERPYGVDRADLYQLTSYLAGLDPDGDVSGMLLYPRDPSQKSIATAEGRGPWLLAARNEVRFERVSATADEAVAEITSLLGTQLETPRRDRTMSLSGNPGGAATT